MKKKIMIIIGLSLLMSQFIYADANMDRLLNEARKKQAAEKAEIERQEKESAKEASNKVEKQEKVKVEKEKPARLQSLLHQQGCQVLRRRCCFRRGFWQLCRP